MGLQTLLKRLAGVKKPTPMERKLAVYLERNYSTLAFEDMESLSAKSGVSKSTISRFVARMGYANFREFLGALKQDAVNGLDTPMKRFSGFRKPSSPEEVLLNHLTEAGNNIQQTIGKIRAADYERALDLLCDEGRHLFLMGGYVTEFHVRAFAAHMHYIRQNFTMLGASAFQTANSLARMRASAVVLAVCTRRYSTATGKLLRYFHEKNHEIILITDSYTAPFFDCATVPLVVQMEGTGTFSSACSVLALLEALLMGMILRFEKLFPERCAAVVEIQNMMDLYAVKG